MTAFNYPSGSRRCYFIRHGQTQWNRENRIQGHSDIPLDDVGFEQARRLAGAFTAFPVSTIFTSWLLRSRQTAQAIADGHPAALLPIVHPDLAEINLGEWEGLTPGDIESRSPGAYARWRNKPSEVAIPNAEPLDAFKSRVCEAARFIISHPGSGDCAVVAHGGVISALLSRFLQADFDHLLRRVRLDNAGITAVEFGPGLPQVLWINNTAHLAGICQLKELF